MFTLNMNAFPLHYEAISHLMIQSGLHWKMPFAQLVMLQRQSIRIESSVTTEVPEAMVHELMKHMGKHTLMGLPIQTYHDADNEGYIELCHDEMVIARMENLSIPLES